MKKVEECEQFNNHGPADHIAGQVGITHRSHPANASTRFAYFDDSERLLVVAGEQEGAGVDLALAYGLTLCGDRRLVLAIPETHALATLQRAPWLTEDTRPVVHLHNGTDSHPHQLGNEEETIDRLRQWVQHGLKSGDTLDGELRKAATPAHLSDIGTRAVFDLVEWATHESRPCATRRRACHPT